MSEPTGAVNDAARPALAVRSVRRNIAASLLGQGWSAAMQLLFIPVYIQLLGIEAYGLIGFYATLQGTLQILDLGLSPTMNRELARYSALGELDEARDFVRTLQTIYWGIGILIGTVVWLTAPILATRWIHASSIPNEAVTAAVRLMGILVVLQWPLSFYGGGLIGLQRQPLFNGIKIVIVTIAYGGGAVVLYAVSNTIEALLTWQIAINAVYAVLLVVALWYHLPGEAPSRLRSDLLRKVWRFAAGMTGIGISALFLTQLDKIILIRVLPLREFGYYALATTVSSGLYMVINSIFSGVFPRFSSLVAKHDEDGLRRLYHVASQIMAVGILPAACVMAFHSHALAFAWTGDRIVTAHAAPVISVLAVGTALNGLMTLPYALQLAYGWTRIGLTITSLLAVLLVPAILVVAPRFGAIGGAGVWIAVNAIYMTVAVPLTHRRLLKGDAIPWLIRDVGLAAAGAASGAALIRLISPYPSSRLAALTSVTTALFLGTLAAGLLAPSTRQYAHKLWRRSVGQVSMPT